MQQELDHFYGLKLSATDRDIGKVKDFYFDDKTWKIRYIVADTGSWLFERQVLLSPHAFEPHALDLACGHVEHLRVNLTAQQIEESPSIETHRVVSRQDEIQYYSYHGWPNYWDNGLALTGGVGFQDFAQPLKDDHKHRGHNQRNDIHLRGAKEIPGYRVQATDGDVGKVQGFVLEGKTWTIQEVIIESNHGLVGLLTRLPMKHVTRICHEESTIFLSISKSKLNGAEGKGAAYLPAS